MSKPIVLWKPRALLSSDDACTTILKYSLPSPVKAPSYTSATASEPLSYVPSLAYFCVRRLVEYPDQLHLLGSTRLRYERPERPQSFDVLRALIPDFRDDLKLGEVDPRLWATLIQLYTGLPDTLHHYVLGLSDPHLPLLQHIPQTPDFCLLTILELPRCRELTDDNIVELKVLHNLCAFDASGTLLSAWGIKQLSKTLAFAEDEEHIGGATTRPRRGPWCLRILSLRDCTSVNDQIFDYLESYPLLCAVDLRGTRCKCGGSSLFRPTNREELFHPSTMCNAVASLARVSSEVYSHSEPFVLRVDGIIHDHAALLAKPSPLARSCTERISNGRPGMFQHGPRGLEAYATFDRRSPEPGGAVFAEYHTMHEAATTEVALHARRQAALAFYRTASRIKYPRTGDGRAKLHDAPTPTAAHRVSVKLLTLFRDPPPWSSLTPPPPLATAESSKSSNGIKRVRTSLANGEVRSEETARKPAQKRAVETLVGMVQKRSQPPAVSLSQTSGDAERRTSTNPFMRRECVSNGLERAVSTEAVRTVDTSAHSPIPRAGARPMKTGLDPAVQPAAQTSTADSQVAPQRPLKPISTLKVPLLPPGVRSMPSKRRTATDSGSIRAAKAKQTTLTPTTTRRDGIQIATAIAQPPGFRPSSKASQANTDQKAKPGQVGSLSKGGFDWQRWGQA